VRREDRATMSGAYDSDTLHHMFAQVGERLAGIEAQLAVLSEKAGVPYSPPNEGIPQEIVDLVHAGNKIEAIRQYRIMTGASLDESRRVVELL
jgi:ribosomal protein L7/L12